MSHCEGDPANTSGVPLEGRQSLPDQVLEGEETYRRMRRSSAGISDPKAPVVGLALSGGGIRSATFCLGILQEMARQSILRIVDLLSTVSGGGYIGSCVTSLLSRNDVINELNGHPPAGSRPDGAEPDPYAWGKQPRPNLQDRVGRWMPLLHRNQSDHLRKYGNFLITRTGAFTREMFRAIGHTAIGLLYTFTVFVIVMFLLAITLLVVSNRLVHEPLWTILDRTLWPGWAMTIEMLTDKWSIAAAGALGFLFALVCVRCSRDSDSGDTGRRSKATATSADTDEDHNERRWLRRYALATGLWFLIVTAVIVERGSWLPAGWRSFWRLEKSIDLPAPHLSWQVVTYPSLSYLLIPLAISLGMILAITLAYGVIGLREKHWTSRRRTLLDGMFGVTSYFVVGGALHVTVLLLVWYLMSAKAVAALGTTVTLFISRFLIPKAGVRSGDNAGVGPIAQAVRRVGIQLIIPAFLILSLVGSCLLVVSACIRFPDCQPVWFLPVLAFGFLLISWIGNFNKISPHYFYRDRLAEAYLRTDVKASTHGMMTVRNDSEMELRCLHGRQTPLPQKHKEKRLEETDADPDPGLVTNPSPYHLIMCSLNLAGSRDLTRRTRKSDVFVFSRLFCGSSTTGWVSSARYRGGWTRFSRAMTISGAAAAPAMGVYTSFTTAFAMALFNIRLGYWILNPRVYGDKTYYPRGGKPPSREIPKKSPWSDDRTDRWMFWPRLLLAEMFGTTNADKSYVNLSDGGHTGDNVGIYPLLQRRCDLIIACDASRDSAGTCAELTEAIRMIDVDEGVKVEINLEDLRSAEGDKRTKAHYTVGPIHYPAVASDTTGISNEKYGWILYIKASLTGDEPAPVSSYKAQHPEFPHQSTADQFFDDDQLESYRALGEHIANGIFRPHTDAKALMEFCRQSWEARMGRDGARVRPRP